MEALTAFWGQYGAIVLAVLGVVIGLATYVARGEGRELAKLTVDFVLRLSGNGWDLVTEKQVRRHGSVSFRGDCGSSARWSRIGPGKPSAKRMRFLTRTWPRRR
jgi:hypothetical protein